MLFRTIDFPDAILEARDRGDLVLFAGAGVSMPSPSSLPSFRGLANKIGDGSGISHEENEPDDRYLGRLKATGVDVHGASAAILVNGSTKPHALHRLLYELFPSSDKVRLVTTNFDIHFTTAAKDLFGRDIATFYAPALPLGNDFSGLVYLHGCAGWDPNRCVLTDEDFGRAYLTEAWAARFLANMFTRYLVVFVGYSHNDTVMNYLSRGLPPKSQHARFAFSIDDADSRRKWGHLAIKPLIYEKTSNENPHRAITDSIEKAVEVLNLGLLGEAQRIQSIVKSSPPLEGEDADYLKFVISKLETSRIFFRHARSPNTDPVQWLSWLERHDLLKPLFDPEARLEPSQHELSFWVADQFLASHSQELLSVIYRNDGRLNRMFCFHIYGRLFQREANAKIGMVFSQWTALLLSQPFDVLGRGDWGFLLMKCQIPADKTVALLLFDRLTRPHVTLDEELNFSENFENVTKSTAFSLNLFDDKDLWTAEAWSSVLKPKLDILGMELEPIIASNLAVAHSLMNLANIPDHDPLYFRRHSIEGSSTIRTLLDVLVDAARDIITHFFEKDTPTGVALAKRWFASDAAILRRLAIFSYSIRHDLTADEKLAWLLKNDLLFRFHEEVRLLLRNTYSDSSTTVRTEVLDRVVMGPVTDLFDDEWKLDKTHRLLIRLSHLAPDCPLTSARLKSFLDTYPQLAPADKPAQTETKPLSRFMDQGGSFDIDVIVAVPPGDFLEELLSKPAIQQQYCNAATNASEREPEWGIEWIKTLILRQITQPNVWTCISYGWKASNMSPEQWHAVLGFLGTIQSPPKDFLVALTELLFDGSERETFNIPDSDLKLADQVATRIWTEALADSPLDDHSFDDWLTVAINRPGGRLAQFWLQRISAERRLLGDSWKGLSEPAVAQLEQIISSTSGAAAHIRIVLASQLHYFFSIDSQFTLKLLLPLFDWKENPLRAEQSWHGFLIWGRLSPGLLEALLPHFTEAVRHISVFPKEMRNRLSESVAVAIVYGIEIPFESGLFNTAFQHFEEGDLVQFAYGIGNLLENAESSVVNRVWNGWLKEYWRRRSLGLPKPVSTREAVVMASWTVDLGEFFPQAVEMLMLFRDRLSFEHSRILMDMEKRDVIARYPNASADLILLYLECPKSFFYEQPARTIWLALKSSSLPNEKLRQVREAMYKRLNIDPEDL